MNNLIEDFARLVWRQDLAILPWWKRVPLRAVRIAYVILRDIMEGRLTLQAMSLVYTTLLSLVPLIAVSFSVLKGFGVHNQVEPLLLGFLEPLGERGVEISNRIIGFVDNVKVGVLGSLGIALLIYTAVSLIQKMEDAYNYTWHVERSRSFATRFSGFLSIIVIGPVLIFTSLGVTATLTSTSFMQALVAIEPFGSLYRLISLMIPFLLVIAAFTLTYLFIPNTTVSLRYALTGAVFAGVLWNVTGKLFAAFVVTSTKYTAIYSGFAIVLFFMIWLYLSWLIVLVGASIAFYAQHPEFLIMRKRDFMLSNRMKERLSLSIMALVGQRFYLQLPGWTVQGLADRLAVPSSVVGELMDIFVSNGLLSRTDSAPPTYLPARPLEHTGLKQVLDVVRRANESSVFEMRSKSVAGDIDSVVAELERAVDEALEAALHERTLKDLALSESTVELGRDEQSENSVSKAKTSDTGVSSS